MFIATPALKILNQKITRFYKHSAPSEAGKVAHSKTTPDPGIGRITRSFKKGGLWTSYGFEDFFFVGRFFLGLFLGFVVGGSRSSGLSLSAS